MNSRLPVTLLIVALSLLTIATNGQLQRSPAFSAWSAPVDLGSPINLPGFADQAAVLSRDEKTLYFTSNRPGSVVSPTTGTGSEDIWVSTRKNKNSPWQTPINLGATINTAWVERVRTLSDDDRVLLYQSDRPDGLGGSDIWAIARKHPNDDFGWSEPVNLGSVINTASNEIAARFFFGVTPKLFFSSNRADLGGLGSGDIYESEMLGDGTFGSPVNRFELNSPSVETCFWVRDDGLEIIFSSNRPNATEDPTAFDLWSATRSNVHETWSAPVSLGPTINVAGVIDVNPALSADGKTLLFSSRRSGDLNIYMSTRRPIRSNP